MRRAFAALLAVAPLVVIVATWQAAVDAGLVTSRLLPAPAAILAAFVTDLGNGTLAWHAAVTIGRALVGFALGAAAGILIAAAMSRSPIVDRLIEPLVVIGYPVPKIALFPIFIFMFGVGSASKIAFAALECLFPVLIASHLGFKGINARLVMAARNFGAPPLTVLRRVVVPAALPGIWSGLKIALPISLIVVVIAEMIGDSTGLGAYITIWGTRFAFDRVFAGIFAVGLVGVGFEVALAAFKRYALGWLDGSRPAALAP